MTDAVVKFEEMRAMYRSHKRKTGNQAATAILGILVFTLVLTTHVGFPQWKASPEPFLLDNGLPGIYQQDASSPITVIKFFIKGGKGTVPVDKDGLAFLASRLSLEITDRNKAQNLMGQATRMGLVTREDCSVITIECLSLNLEEALKMASSIITNPVFSGVRIDAIKEIMSLRRRAEEDDSVISGHNALLEALFRGRGYGGAVYGTEGSLRALNKKDILERYQNSFTSGRTLFSVCSDLDKVSVQNLLQRYFGRLARSDPKTPPVPLPSPVLPEKREIIIEKETKQTFVSKAFLLPEVSRRTWTKTFLLEVLLGKGPGSRLWDLRSREKLAYNVNVRITWMRTSGVLEAYLETENAKRAEAIKRLGENIRSLHESGVEEEEFHATQTLARAWFLRENETKEARARTMGFWEILGLGAGFLEGLFSEIDAVTQEEMNSFIREVLVPEKGIQVIVGPRVSTEEPVSMAPGCST